MSQASCLCCEEVGQCPPIPGWITLHIWRGGYTVPNDLRDYQVWQDMELDNWQQAVWLWRIVVLNTGDVADDTPMCLAQNRRAHRAWTTPAGPAEGFTAEFEPLQVGTTWQGRIRTAYGEPIKRSLRETGQANLFANSADCGDPEILDVTVALAQFQAAGTVLVTASRAFEFALQVQCFGCRYDQEFALWSQSEQSMLRFTGIYNLGEVGHGQDTCPNWSEGYSNTPYVMVRKFGPDGVDGHLRNEGFFADGVITPRKPVCDPNVVLLGDGCFVQQYLSAKFDPQPCETDGACPNKPRLEYLVEEPVAALSRLKAIYGSDFSYWGGWIDYAASRTDGVIVTRFEEYDLSEVNVLFLGGLMAGAMGPLGGKFGDVARYQIASDLVNLEFADGSLDALRRWLDQGERVLVLDGGLWPQTFFTALGLSSSVEPFGQYVPPGGSVSENTLNFKQWGPELPDFLTAEYHETYFQELYVEPLAHPFTTNVRSAIDSAGEAALVPDATFSGSGIAGQPRGTGNVTRGLITLSQKWDFDVETKPAAGLRSYTSVVPLVTPGADAEVIGRVRGEVPVAPWFADGAYVTVPVDYPGIVCESWRAAFRLRFNHDDSIETTDVLPANATADQIQEALAALPNIGPTPTVTGGPLPYDITITFDTPLTELQDVAQLEVLDSGCWRIDTASKGVADSENELQVLSRERTPSRVIVSQVNELIEPDGWGQNWDDASAANIGTPGGGELTVGQNGFDSRPYQKITGIRGCSLVTLEFYDRHGYGWGLGLSTTAAAQFLLNLRDRRTEWW